MRRRSVRWLTVVLLALSVVLAGCVSVPTSGPVEKVEGQQQTCQTCVNVEVAPPTPGDDAKQVVEGYLRATSNYQPNYSVAKQFLTRAAAEKWSPEDGVSVFTGNPVATGNKVALEGQLIGTLGADRTYTARDQPLKVDFGLVKEDNEWRINTPPAGLLVQEFSFTYFYKPYNLYFIGNQISLVPDRIYLPNLRNQDNVASALMKALLNGPSRWLKPVVGTAIPVNTTLSVDSVRVVDGVAQVPLSDTVLALNDQQRSQLAAQVVFTLQQAIGVKGVLFTVNQQPYLVPESDPSTFVVGVDAYQDVAPIPFVGGEQLYAVRNGGVQVLGPNADAAQAQPMPGALGTTKYAITSVAVSVANTDVAVVTDGGTLLRRTPAGGGDVTTVLTGVTDLLRPQFTRYGELWALGRQNGQQKLWMFAGTTKNEVDASSVIDDNVTAFKISPDGTRIALVRTVGGRSEVGLARIGRARKITVDGWRPLDTTGSKTPNLTRIQDVGWVDANNLIILAAASKDASLSPYKIAEDASSISSEGEANRWNAVGVTILLRTQAVVVVGGDGQTYRDDGSQWLPFLDKVTAAAFPG